MKESESLEVDAQPMEILREAAPGAQARGETLGSCMLGALGEDEVVVVSGLPRSGTSMLMQMLAAGGMPVLADQQREADEDNPRGYFELAAVKKGADDLSWVALARQKAVKVVAPLVGALPVGYRYRVVFVERAWGEMLDSQSKMIARRSVAGTGIEDTPQRRERLRSEYKRLLVRVKALLSSRANVELLVLRYDEVVCAAAEAAHRLNGFLGGTLNESRMAAAVDPSLHRNRA